jgi:hypothetical protein
MKTCKACKVAKPYTEFNKRVGNADGYRTQCKACWSIYNKKRYDDPKYVEQHRSNHLKRKYGITLADYETMLASQNNSCAICKSESPKRNSQYFMVDHNHQTGEVRGLLCHPCNSAIGLLGDNISSLEAAVTYLSTTVN